MQIEIPRAMEPVAREKALQAGFHDVGEYVISLLREDAPGGEPRPVPGQSAASPAAAGDISDWTDEKNARRCELIDKDIQGALTDAQRNELAILTRQFREHRRRHAPLPIEGARQIHAELLEKKRRREQGGQG